MQMRSTNSEFEFIFENLVDSTLYNVEARAYIKSFDLGFFNETVHGLMCK